MTFGLAEPAVIDNAVKRFRSILANYTDEKRLPGRPTPLRRIPGDRFADFVIDLHGMFVQHFESGCVPPPTLAFLDLGNRGTMAEFRPEPWLIVISDALVFSKLDLPLKFAPVVFSSLYHEYRHAEQFALMIRYAWAQHPLWLQYQNLLYGEERNPFAPPRLRVDRSMKLKAFSDWETAVRRMNDASIQAMISRHLTSVGGAKVSLKVTKALRTYPLGILHGDTQAMMNQAALWHRSRHRTWTEVRGDRANLLERARLLELDETGAANTAMAEATLLADAVDREIKGWNQARPAAFPEWTVDRNLPAGRILADLRAARRRFNGAAMKACYNYLVARREAALSLMNASHEWYESVPLEADTHALERQVMQAVRLKQKTVNAVARSAGVLPTGYLPMPTDWSAGH